ncbi:hypothetical protein M1466_01455 [Candidatus Dependentiae bacterium]|nr:hypothetical protein [Candidatus Dependentiae bacterium]
MNYNNFLRIIGIVTSIVITEQQYVTAAQRVAECPICTDVKDVQPLATYFGCRCTNVICHDCLVRHLQSHAERVANDLHVAPDAIMSNVSNVTCPTCRRAVNTQELAQRHGIADNFSQAEADRLRQQAIDRETARLLRDDGMVAPQDMPDRGIVLPAEQPARHFMQEEVPAVDAQDPFAGLSEEERNEQRALLAQFNLPPRNVAPANNAARAHHGYAAVPANIVPVNTVPVNTAGAHQKMSVSVPTVVLTGALAYGLYHISHAYIRHWWQQQSANKKKRYKRLATIAVGGIVSATCGYLLMSRGVAAH